MFIGLNPSTADETVDDPMVRRCIGYAQKWGYAGLCIVNLFAFRATLPKDMKVAEDPVGPDNDSVIIDVAKHQVDIVVAAWGINGAYMGRDKKVKAMISRLHYLKLTKNGFPSHPLYLPKKLNPVPWFGSNKNS